MARQKQLIRWRKCVSAFFMGCACSSASFQSVRAFQMRLGHVLSQRQSLPMALSTGQSSPLFMVDPADAASHVGAAMQHHSEPISAILSTLLSSATKTMVPMAHGHSNPFFGPPDPILSSGKSIIPPVKTLIEMGIEHPMSSELTTPNDILPSIAPEIRQSVQDAMQKGFKILDASTFQSGSSATHFPGFRETRGFLPQHLPVVSETSKSFWAQVAFSADYVKVLDALPFAAFWYAFFEFSFLRRNVVLYKEEIEDDAMGVFSESVVVVGVRLVVLAVIALITVSVVG